MVRYIKKSEKIHRKIKRNELSMNFMKSPKK